MKTTFQIFKHLSIMDCYVFEGAAETARPSQIQQIIWADTQVEAPVPGSGAFLPCPASWGSQGLTLWKTIPLFSHFGVLLWGVLWGHL